MTKPYPMIIILLKWTKNKLSRKRSESKNIAVKINLPSAESDSPAINDTSDDLQPQQFQKPLDGWSCWSSCSCFGRHNGWKLDWGGLNIRRLTLLRWTIIIQLCFLSSVFERLYKLYFCYNWCILPEEKSLANIDSHIWVINTCHLYYHIKF